MQCLIAPFQQKPLLWIHGGCLCWRYAECATVELLGARNKASVRGSIYLFLGNHADIYILIDDPPLSWHAANCIAAR
jgi:hypothetical protein